MLIGRVLGLKYSRYLCSVANTIDTQKLKSDFDYSFIVAYESISDIDYDIISKNAGIIHLEKGLDAAFRQFSATCRNEINRTWKIENLEFSCIRNAGYQEYNFHKECENLRGWYPVPEIEFRNSLVFIASWRDEYISGISCYENEHMIRIGRIFSKRRIATSESTPSVLFSAASRRLVFEICQYAEGVGKEFVDLGGIDLTSNEKAGITQFKQSFGIEILPVKIGRWMNDKFRENEQRIKKAGYDLT